MLNLMSFYIYIVTSKNQDFARIVIVFKMIFVNRYGNIFVGLKEFSFYPTTQNR